MGDLEKVLPDKIVNGALWPGNELVIPYAEVSRAVGIATEHKIAVLGFEAFEVDKDGFYTRPIRRLERIHFAGDRLANVVALNTKAEHWMNERRYGTNHGYILPPASKSEFDDLQEM